ncbi:MAG TPA: c-type cytochrome [Candidatus Acidoferrales bacterium]
MIQEPALHLPVTNKKIRLIPAAITFCAVLLCMAMADGSWLKNVSPDYHAKTNPFAAQPDAIAGGAYLFSDHCAKCHGKDALGRGKHPSLRSERVQKLATDGDLFWLLKNGSLGRGMPNWSAIPEPSRWQLIAYVKSLGVSSTDNSSNTEVPKEKE